MSKEVKIMIAIAVVVIGGGLLLFLKGNPQPVSPGGAVDSQSLVREHSPMTGNRDAKVTIVEFGDFQCPGCAAVASTVRRIKDDYPADKVNVVFRNFPLLSIHPNAKISAEAAMTAGEQGKFWEMYYALYEKQSEWSQSGNPVEFFTRYAGEIGIDQEKFKQSLSQGKFANVVSADLEDSDKLSLTGTPTFFINGEKQEQAIPSYEQFKEKIDALLAQ